MSKVKQIWRECPYGGYHEFYGSKYESTPENEDHQKMEDFG